jgi:hypothetical protein
MWVGRRITCISEHVQYHGLQNFMIESIFDQAIGELPVFLLAVEASKGGARLTGYG